MSLLIGPSGIALMGNFRSFLTSVQSLSNLGIKDGIVSIVSEKKDDKTELKKVFSTAFLIVLVISVFVGFLVFISSTFLNGYLFPNESYTTIFKLVAFLLPLSALNIFLIAVLNGFNQYKKIIIINSIANILGLGLLLFLMWKFTVEGALLAAILGESVIVFITLFFVQKNILNLFAITNYSSKYTNRFLRYSLMAVVTAIVLPLTFILIRNTIIENLSVDDAGYWEALNRISGIYMAFVASGLTLYYLPKLAEIKTDLRFKNEVIIYYKILVPLFLILITIIYLCRNWLIPLILSNDFIVVKSLLIWQLLGDLLKVMSLAFGYQILVKSMIKKYVFIEVLFGLVFYVLSVYFINFWGLFGIVKAYFVANAVNFICMLFFFRKTLFSTS